MQFYVGLHQPSDARHFSRCFVSMTRLQRRRSDFVVHDWIMDSGAFSTIARHGGYPEPVETYAAQIRRWRTVGHLQAAVAQDYMCEAWMLEKTGFTVADHQRLTIERYDVLAALVGNVPYVLPVLQGYAPADYVRHLTQYGDRLRQGAWVGVGSVCKRNGKPAEALAVLQAIKAVRPDLRLHGFGLKITALDHPEIRAALFSADSMAWSFHARKWKRNPNDWREAARFVERIEQGA